MPPTATVAPASGVVTDTTSGVVTDLGAAA